MQQCKIPPAALMSLLGFTHTFRRGTTEKRPRKLTTKRKAMIQPKEGSLTPRAASPEWLAIRSLIANR